MNRLFIAAASFAMFALSGCAGMGPGWVTLIDGERGMENFTSVGETPWTVKDGAIQADRGGKAAGYLVSKNSYRDFHIRVEFWASHDANSGIYMRCQNPAVITDKTCYEANIFDQRPDPSYGTGAIVHIAKVAPMPQAGGQWNVFDITVQGPRIVVVLNGKQTVDVQDKQFASGPIALQWGRGVIKFRKLQIREL